MLTSILRTIVSYLWGIIILWLVGLVPPLEPLRDQLLGYSDTIAMFLAVLISGAWYAFWRWLEPRLPDWLTRILLGSAKAPVYPGERTNHELDE